MICEVSGEFVAKASQLLDDLDSTTLCMLRLSVRFSWSFKALAKSPRLRERISTLTEAVEAWTVAASSWLSFPLPRMECYIPASGVESNDAFRPWGHPISTIQHVKACLYGMELVIAPGNDESRGGPTIHWRWFYSGDSTVTIGCTGWDSGAVEKLCLAPFAAAKNCRRKDSLMPLVLTPRWPCNLWTFRLDPTFALKTIA